MQAKIIHQPKLILGLEPSELVVVVVENRRNVGWLDEMLTALHEQNICTGVAHADQLQLDLQTITRGRFDAPFAAQQLLRDPALECLVMQISDVTMLNAGLPVDCIDLLVLSGITGFPANLAALALELSSRSRHVLIDQDSPLWKQNHKLFQQPEHCSEQQLQARVISHIHHFYAEPSA